MTGGAHLLERTAELAALEGSLSTACTGGGAVVLVEGPPGIGKTTLLTETTARANERGMLVLSACGGELEFSFPYAVVRQLFEPVLAQADGATRAKLLSGAAAHAASVVDPLAEAVATALEPSAVLHGLYWLTANLSADRPVALVVDDLHWSDPASVTWLAYLARHISGLPVALVLGARPVEPGVDHSLLERLRATEDLACVRPAPLTRHALAVDAVRTVARADRAALADGAVLDDACRLRHRNRPRGGV